MRTFAALSMDMRKDGFLVIAPAIFDRFEPGVQLTYQPDDMQKAYKFYGMLKPETTPDGCCRSL